MDYFNHALTIYYAIMTTGQFNYLKTFTVYFILFLLIFSIIYIMLKK